MKNKIVMAILLMILVLITCSSMAFAEDNLDNITLTTSGSEIEVISHEDSSSEVLKSSEITITDDNYEEYFNIYTGKLNDDVDVNINTIKVGNVSNKVFTIDRPLNLMPFSSDCEISNGLIHLIAGSSGSNITGLTINNTKGELYHEGLFVSKLHGIWFSNSSDNLIYNNTIRIPGAEGCYAMPMGYSNRNKIIYNDIVSTFTSGIVMGSCDYNNISHNSIIIKHVVPLVAANTIYFNPFGHADYSGPAECIGTYISNNYLETGDNSIWAYTLNVLGESNYTKIINNTVVKGFYGIKVYDEWTYGMFQPKNILIKDNTIINSYNSVLSSSRDVIIANNKIMGSSMMAGIDIAGGYHEDNASVFGNEIDYEDLSVGISVGVKTKVFNNTIRLSRYGGGIHTGGNGSLIANNYIHVNENAIGISASNVTVKNNVINTKTNGVVSNIDKEKNKIENNLITGNKIYSERYAISIEGYIYNTTIEDNYVETNITDAFYINMRPTLENNNPGKISDNTVNGIIKDTEILIVNDTNFYDYFDEEGYLKHNFKENSQNILFLTFLSNKNLYFTEPIILTSNKQANLLYNVTITLKEDASDSTIKDFKFYSFDKESIILEGVDNVVVKDNDFTTLSGDNFDIKTISVIKGCNFCNITNNNIFLNSNAQYTYAILVSEPQSILIKKFSKNFTISNNNILIKSSGVAEAMYFDALTESNITNNNINIISDGSAYGISICDIIGKPNNVLIDSNIIIANSNEMSYLIELFKVDNCQITNNYLKGTSNGVYSIGLYNSSANINSNEIIVEGNNLTTLPPADALGKGNSVVYLTKQSQIKEFKNNMIDSQSCQIIDNIDSDIANMMSNYFVISNYNYDLFFNPNGLLFGENIKNGDIILFKNFTNSKTMNFNVTVEIKPFAHFNEFRAKLILSNGSNKSTISGFNFNNANIELNNVSDIIISLNNFTNSKISDCSGVNNTILNNSFVLKNDDVRAIIFNNCLNDTFIFNNILVNSSNVNFIDICSSGLTKILKNSFVIFGNSISVINSNSSSNSVLNNIININATGNIYGYCADYSTNDEIINNTILINVNGNPIAVYYNNSCENVIKFNSINSKSNHGQDYAIIIDSQKNNVVTNNYLISSNGFKKGNGAVNATNNIVHDNLPVFIYVSTNGTGDGDGTFENPYPTIKKAIDNCLSGSILYLLPGMYNESNIVIDKNITLTAVNLEGNTYINALGNQLFNIRKEGILSINALKIFNGFSIDGGSLFNNSGSLFINNSLIYNSSSYYDNSNPIFNVKKKYDRPGYIYTHDCSNEGVGGAILNYGDLIISSSTLFNNFAHKGGAIADFGKTTIKDSLICNNVGVHGGAIYTDSKNECIIENSIFKDNLAIQTLDYCFIQRANVDYHMEVIRYHYLSMCEVLPGLGGAIFSNTRLSIDNSSFEHNLAKTGGAIAYGSNLLINQNYYHDQLDYSGKGSQIKYSPTAILNINNSIFKDNEATNTSCGNLSMLVDTIYGGKVYDIHYDGGAIFGALIQFNVYNSTFSHNSALSDGGSLCVQALDSSIELSKFYDNVAGISGGALDVFGNFEVFNTEIVNNSANYGGAMQYSSYSEYGHIQKNMDMFNVTIAGNKALTSGGAFTLQGTNFAIKNSNIHDNFAPQDSTFSGRYNTNTWSNIDARGNWWGSIKGPDDSVWNQNNIKFKTWSGQKVDWKTVLVQSNKENNNQNSGNSDKSSSTSTVSTGSGAHTGSTLSMESSYQGKSSGFKFNGNWPNGNNIGNNGGFSNTDGINPFSSSENSKTAVDGNAINPNSLSKVNSSSINNLASVGMMANTADSFSSSQSSSTEGANGDPSNAYEITKEIKKEIVDDNFSIFNMLFIVLWIFLFIGFYRKYKNCDET